MRTLLKLIFVFLFTFAILLGCDQEPLPPVQIERGGESEPQATASALTLKVNEFIEYAMQDIYLWSDEIPEIDIRYEMDSKAYFEKLLYAEDKWSFVTDDIVSVENSFEGIEKSYGWSLAFGQFSNTQTYFAMVEFVYPNTPAAEAGIKRGDLIVGVNLSDITEKNYMELLNGNTVDITMGVLDNESIGAGSKLTLNARELHLNPVVFTNIVEQDNHKIGYLFYAQYIANYNSSLDSAFQHFKDEQITELVLDLRYNPGGGTQAAQHLCSSIAPASVVDNNSTLVTFQWNDNWQSHWEETNDTEQLMINFTDIVPQNLDLNKLHVITGRGTASASELTITGLKPYMDVTTIGESTYGKYTASWTIKPEHLFNDSDHYKDFSNWGIQPIILRYANSEGVTDFKDGFTPDIPLEENLIMALPLGQKEEALFKAAIEDITGTPIVAMKSTRKEIKYKFIDRGFSKFDKNKREVHIDHFDYKDLK